MQNRELKLVIAEDLQRNENNVIAKVLFDKQSPFLKSIVLNKGTKSNLKKGMAVLNDSYLIGKVVEINYSTSRVLLLSDLNSKIPVTIEPGSIQSILSGNGINSGIIQYTKKNILIDNGSLVFTSGTGGLLKAGIPIGKIIKIEDKKNVEFFVDFTQLRYVQVASYEEKENK